MTPATQITKPTPLHCTLSGCLNGLAISHTYLYTSRYHQKLFKFTPPHQEHLAQSPHRPSKPSPNTVFSQQHDQGLQDRL